MAADPPLGDAIGLYLTSEGRPPRLPFPEDKTNINDDRVNFTGQGIAPGEGPRRPSTPAGDRLAFDGAESPSGRGKRGSTGEGARRVPSALTSWVEYVSEAEQPGVGWRKRRSLTRGFEGPGELPRKEAVIRWW